MLLHLRLKTCDGTAQGMKKCFELVKLLVSKIAMGKFRILGLTPVEFKHFTQGGKLPGMHIRRPFGSYGEWVF